MDEKTTLQRMHALDLILADEIRRICEKHGIRYYISAGTMLGAVRHGGFIPWDDDMDFSMPRPDFDRFLEICPKELDDAKFCLQTDENDLLYPFNFAKLRLRGTHVKEEFSQGVQVDDGIYVDIFPIDVVPENKIKRAIQFKTFWFVRSLLWIKCGYSTQKQRAARAYRIGRVLAKPFTIRFLKKLKRKIITRYCGKPYPHVVTSDGIYGLKKEVLNRRWTEESVPVAFEDRVYPGVKDAHAYLSHMYGDYMKLPPEDQRNHHDRLNVDFGEYFPDKQ